jgi:hypothetical protein
MLPFPNPWDSTKIFIKTDANPEKRKPAKPCAARITAPKRGIRRAPVDYGNGNIHRGADGANDNRRDERCREKS